MLIEVRKFAVLISGVRNPIPAVLDRLGLRRAPYRLHMRSGPVLELRPRAGDLFGFYEILLRGDYFSAGQTLEPGATVIDIGANIGCFTVAAAKMVGPKGRVFAIEPEESTYRQLLRNIDLNYLTNVVPLKIAVGGRAGAVSLRTAENRLFSSVFSSVNGQDVRGSEQEVQMFTLDALMDEHGIRCCDYLKLDCEGAEHDIIGTMTAVTARRVTQITMEVHKVPGHDGAALEHRLSRLGYRRVGDSTLPFYKYAVGGVVDERSSIGGKISA